jgi:hypothetical protein
MDRISDGDPPGIFISTAGLSPMPIAFVSFHRRDAVRLALKLIAGKGDFRDVVDYRGLGWSVVGACINSAILYPLNPITGRPEQSAALAAAMVLVNPLTGAARFSAFSAGTLRDYLATQRFLDWAIPQALATSGAEAES